MSTDDQDTDDPRPWPMHGSKPGANLYLFQPRWDRRENPRTGEILPRLVLETPEWVNVVPMTPEGHLVCVRQFRFGTERVTTEIPGGVVDPGEEPLAAARRELREETGFTSSQWVSLGAVEPNPAFLDNRCHHYLARDVQLTHPQELDGGEDIQIVTLTRHEVLARIASGDMDHALVLTALARVLDLRIPGTALPEDPPSAT